MSKNKREFGPCAVGMGGALPAPVSAEIRVTLKNLEGQIVKITITKQVRRRSMKQNGYYWSAVIPAIVELFAEHGTIASDDDVHDYLRQHVGGVTKHIASPTGDLVSIPASTTELSTMEFEQYLDAIRAWAMQFGKVIALPNEDITQEIMDENRNATNSTL